MKLVSYTSLKWISFILLLVYSASPFINGLGCDYQQQYERDNFSFYSTCKFGYAKNVVHNKITGQTLRHSGLIGKHGDSMIFIAFNIERSPDYPYQDIYSVMSSDRLYLAKIINKDKNKDALIVMTYPYHRLQKVKTIGRQSFW